MEPEKHTDDLIPLAQPARTAQEAAVRLLEQRKGNELPDDITIRALIVCGRS